MNHGYGAGREGLYGCSLLQHTQAQWEQESRQVQAHKGQGVLHFQLGSCDARCVQRERVVAPIEDYDYAYPGG